eukprot:6254019-Prymnesium_polylepis.1
MLSLTLDQNVDRTSHAAPGGSFRTQPTWPTWPTPLSHHPIFGRWARWVRWAKSESHAEGKESTPARAEGEGACARTGGKEQRISSLRAEEESRRRAGGEQKESKTTWRRSTAPPATTPFRLHRHVPTAEATT